MNYKKRTIHSDVGGHVNWVHTSSQDEVVIWHTILLFAMLRLGNMDIQLADMYFNKKII